MLGRNGARLRVMAASMVSNCEVGLWRDMDVISLKPGELFG